MKGAQAVSRWIACVGLALILLAAPGTAQAMQERLGQRFTDVLTSLTSDGYKTVNRINGAPNSLTMLSEEHGAIIDFSWNDSHRVNSYCLTFPLGRFAPEFSELEQAITQYPINGSAMSKDKRFRVDWYIHENEFEVGGWAYARLNGGIYVFFDGAGVRMKEKFDLLATLAKAISEFTIRSYDESEDKAEWMKRLGA